MTAKGSSADSHTAYDLGFISHADLTQLDPGLKHRCKILYQFTEVDTSVCCKIEENLIVIKGILYIDQFHLQLMLADLLLTDFEGILLFLAVCFLAGNVFLICHTNDCF